MYSTLPEAGLKASTEASGQLVDNGQQQQVVVVRSASTILPCVDCGVVLHPGTEAGRRVLAIHSKDFRPIPSVEVMVHLIDGQLRLSSASFSSSSSSSSSSTWLSLLPSASLVQSWMTFVRPARDRYEQNLELVRDPLGRLCLKTVRLVRPGDELLLWYSEELARNSGVPIISPANITRDEEYVCTACKSRFRYPNTLKSHVMFDCRLPFTSLLLTRCRQFPPFCFSPWSASGHRPEVTLATGFPLLLNRACAELDRKRYHGNERLPTEGAFPVPVMTSSARGQFLTSVCSAEALVTCAGSLRQFHDTSGGKRLPLLQRMFADVSSGLNALSDWPAMLTSSDDCPIKSKRTKGRSIRELSPEEGSCADSKKLPEGPAVKDGTSDRDRGATKKRVRHHCQFCGKLYSRKYGLTIHLRTHSGHKPLKCRVCLRPFGDPSNLNKHVRLHGDGDTPYRCRHCGKVLVRRRDLDRHIRSRHPDVSEGVENVTNVTKVTL